MDSEVLQSRAVGNLPFGFADFYKLRCESHLHIDRVQNSPRRALRNPRMFLVDG